MTDLLSHFEAARRLPAGHELCGCCEGHGEHPTGGWGGTECYRCDASGSVSPSEAKLPYCEGSENRPPRRRHWREAGLTAGDMTYYSGTIPVNGLVPTEHPSRQEVGPDYRNYMRNLTDHIREHGIESVQPIQVHHGYAFTTRSGTRTSIIDGHHTWLAAKRLGIDRVPAHASSETGEPPPGMEVHSTRNFDQELERLKGNWRPGEDRPDRPRLRREHRTASMRRMPMEQILKLRPGDYPEHATVRDAFPDIREKISQDYEDAGEELRDRMSRGIQPGGQIVVNRGRLDDGHRRVLMAHELGWDSMYVRSGKFGPVQHESAWTPHERIFGPTYGLDHRLFTEDGELRPEVREAVLEHMDQAIRVDWQIAGTDQQDTFTLYLAGSEASEWTSPELEGNNDFDVLVDIDYDAWRGYGNSDESAMTDEEITDSFNLAMRKAFNDEEWHPAFGGTWHLTGYCNGRPITEIRPYAAYDITHMRWVQKPPHLPEHSAADFPPALLAEARAVASQLRAILKLEEPYRTSQARSLWQHIHDMRSEAFSPSGGGWSDPGNVIEKYLDQHPHNLLGKLRSIVFAKTAAREKPTMTKEQVNYREGSKKEHCGNCTMIRLNPPDFESHSCTLVKGLIEPRMVCDEWYPEGKKEAAVRQVPSRDGPDGVSKSMMVAVVPPGDVLDHLQDIMKPLRHDTEPRAKMHITLLYLGETDDHPDAHLGKLADLVRQWAKTQRPFKATVQGTGTFANDGKHVLHALVDIPGGHEVHGSLRAFLRGHGISAIPQEHGFIPHITLAYSKQPIRFIPKVDKMTWPVEEIWYCRGGRWESIPLTHAVMQAEGRIQPARVSLGQSRKLVEATRKNGGHSAHVKTMRSPRGGYMVAQEEGSHIVPSREFFGAKGPRILRDYVHSHSTAFAHPRAHLGTWHDTESGNVFLDISHNVGDERQAIEMGKSQNQIAVWDVKNSREIPTGGTGGLEKSAARDEGLLCPACGLEKTSKSATMQFARQLAGKGRSLSDVEDL